ncbi:RHS repeat-associated core domain-containing protein [Tenacibaculum maritimum]|uniref:RHS repeat domain-containing protein n=2 Tax=Tenacibaculum maritimum TaxID=107401 RepID=UPI0038777146
MYDEEGEQVWERSLDLNGKVINGSNAPCPFLYQGQYYDKEIELAYNRFRYYDPDDGRYISKDPIGLESQEANFYSYVGDSNTWIDVFGLEGGIVTILLQEGGSHFGIITDGVGGMQTDLNQLGDLGTGTNDYAKIMKNSDLYVFDKYLNVEVVDLDAAKKTQLKEIARGDFKYHKFNDSCLTHVAKVLKAGGEDIDPNSIKSQIKYMREKEGKFKKISCG